VQERVRDEDKRFKVIPAGRRSGKTELAKRKIVVEALSANDTPWPDPRFFAAAPTRDQVKAIYWADLKAMFPPAFIRKKSESDLSIVLENGAEAYAVGMDKPERIEGRPWDGGILDEYANMKSQAFPENVRPALADRKGWCWLIGVPEGRNHYYDLYKYSISGEDVDWGGYTWPSSDIIDPAEVEAARRQLDELVFAQEFEGSFINFEGRIYYPFTEATHCADLRGKYNPHQPLIFCFDFNVAPGVAAVCQEMVLPGQYERGTGGAVLLDRPITGTGVIGEVYIPRNSNTPAVCRKLIADWGNHIGDVYCYGDATGGAEGSAKVQGSDWALITKEMNLHFGSSRVYIKVRLANPRERARINAVNSRLKNTVSEIHMLIDPKKAPHVVVDFEGVRVLEGSAGEIDKKSDPNLTHISDGIGYYIEREFPLGRTVASITPIGA
jgi:hypothetical protein